MLLDDTFSCPWKSCELEYLGKFHEDIKILFKSHAPESILNKLKPQIAESIRIWCLYRDKIKVEMNLSDCHYLEPIWFNCILPEKSKLINLLCFLVRQRH